MLTLEERHPQIAEAFHAGKFVVHKPNRDFSGMAIDQAHVQSNAVIKGDGGKVGITEDPSALRRRMVAGPAVSQLEEKSPAEWGWKQEGDCLSILWSTLPPVAQSCQQLTKCQCKMQCR